MTKKLSAIIASNIRTMRKARHWSAQNLVDRVAGLDGVLTRVMISKIENGTREVSVDDLAIIAAALGVEPWSLTRAPDCDQCQGIPPTGFTCNGCGRGAQ